MIAYLCLGSNLHKPRAQVQKAVRLLAADPKITVLRKSSLIRSVAYGETDQPDFRNQVVEVKTDYTPHNLLQKLLTIENDMGRVRREKWGARVIDIDILLYEDQILNSNTLVLPHPDFHNRRFAVQLLCELEPELVHPVLGKTISALLDELGGPEEEGEGEELP